MDLRLKDLSRTRGFPTPQDGLRIIAEKAPQAEEMAASWLEHYRTFWQPVFAFRRRIGTFAVAALACLLFVHVMLGANGMVVYRQKRAEYRDLQKRIEQVKTENERCAEQIRGLKSDERAIEREAREQLHYARPGEYVYVQPVTPSPSPATHSAKN